MDTEGYTMYCVGRTTDQTVQSGEKKKVMSLM